MDLQEQLSPNADGCPTLVSFLLLKSAGVKAEHVRTLFSSTESGQTFITSYMRFKAASFYIDMVRTHQKGAG